MTLRTALVIIGPVGSIRDLDLASDEEDMWLATVKALRSKGATPSEAVESAHFIVAAYRQQRDALPSQIRIRRPLDEPDE